MGGRRSAFVGKGLTARAGVAQAMAPGRTGKNQPGFSLLEMLISVAIAGIVMGAMYNLFITKQKILGVQDQVAEMHQAARVAMDFMVREFRMIGYGMPNSSWDGCTAPCPPAKISGTPTTTSITFRGNLDATKTNLTNDHACVTYVLGTTPSTMQCVTGLTTLTVDSTVGFNVGDTIYVEGQNYSATPYVTHWYTATVQPTPPPTATTLPISPGLNFEYVRGSTVHVIQTVTYDHFVGLDSSGHPVAQIRRNLQPLAENIQQLTLNYFFQAGGTMGLADDVDAVTTNNTSNIRTINISIIARTPKKDPTYTQEYDGYRKVTVTSQVTPRNLP